MARPWDFVDRCEETKILEDALQGKRPERVLVFLVEALLGKTYLMNHFLDCCVSRVPLSVLVDLDSRNRDGEAVTYWKFARLISDGLGLEFFPEVAAFEKRYGENAPFIAVQTGPGEGGASVGTKGRFDDVELSDTTGRDRIEVRVSDVAYLGTGDGAKNRQERLKHEMGLAFRNDLARLCQSQRVVILIDTYEQVSQETRHWIHEWLFCRIPDYCPGLSLVIAGRPEEREYLTRSIVWAAPIRVFDRLSHLEEEHVRAYAQIHGTTIDKATLGVLMSVGRRNMGAMAMVTEYLKT